MRVRSLESMEKHRVGTQHTLTDSVTFEHWLAFQVTPAHTRLTGWESHEACDGSRQRLVGAWWMPPGDLIGEGGRAPGSLLQRLLGSLGVEETLWENTSASSFGVLLVCHPRLPSWNTLQSKEFGVDYFQPSAFTLSRTKRKSWLGKLRGVHISQNHQYPSSAGLDR